MPHREVRGHRSPQGSPDVEPQSQRRATHVVSESTSGYAVQSCDVRLFSEVCRGGPCREQLATAAGRRNTEQRSPPQGHAIAARRSRR